MNKRILNKQILFFGLIFSLPAVLPRGLAQDTTPANAPHLREVRGQTILSKEMPAAALSFGKDFRYVGGQIVNLYGNADGEQHLFVKVRNGSVERFYWVQFEHFLPTNTHTYDYAADRTTDIGGLQFVYDVKSWPEYAAMQLEDPASDGAAMSRLLTQHHLSFPRKAARVRMFHLPTPDRRTELMIIYGEALPEDSKIPVRKDGVELEKESPESARLLLDDARKDLSIRKR